MKKNWKMEIEKIIFVCNLKMNITPKISILTPYSKLWGQSTVET